VPAVRLGVEALGRSGAHIRGGAHIRRATGGRACTWAEQGPKRRLHFGRENETESRIAHACWKYSLAFN
jgi:hypothetical protein